MKKRSFQTGLGTVGILASCLMSTGLIADEAAPAALTHWQANTFEQSTQAQSSIAAQRDGTTVAVWSSRRQQDGQYGIYAQRFDVDGIAIGNETCLNLYTTSHQTWPSIVASTDGGYWVAWRSHGQDGQQGSIIVRHLDASLNGGDEILANTTWRGDQFQPMLAARNDGGVIVGWHHVLTPTAPPKLTFTMLNKQGVVIHDETRVAIPDGLLPRQAAIAARADNSFAIAYNAASNSNGKPQSILMQRFDADANVVGNPIVVDEMVGTRPIEPVLLAGAQGYVASWLRTDFNTGAHKVVCRSFDTNGLPASDFITVHEHDAGRQHGPALAWAPNSTFQVAFNSVGDERTDMMIRSFELDGTAISKVTQLNDATSQGSLQAASSSRRMVRTEDGRTLVVWNGALEGHDQSGVHVTMHNPKGLDLAGRVQGVRPEMIAAATAALDLAGPQPHDPPTFDEREIDDSARVVHRGRGGDVGFTGIVNSGWTPPDPHMAVGKDHIVAMTNGAIAFFDKDGTLLFQDEIEGSGGFWGSVGASGFIFDPEAIYDPMSERYFVMAADQDSGVGKSFFLLAVSDDDNPVGNWHKYRIDTSALSGPTFDSPNIAVDGDAVYVTGDGFGGPEPYPMYILDKASVLAGNPPAVLNSLALTTSTQSAGIPPVTVPGAPGLYMVEHRESGSNTQVRLLCLKDGLGSPVVTSTNLTVPSYGPPELPPQAGTSTRPITFDARFWSCAYGNGSLWATHHINNDRVLARWYEFDMRGWPDSGMLPLLVQSGEIDPGSGIRTYFSAISVDDEGSAAMTYARSSPDEFISMGVAFRSASDPLGTFNPGTIVAQSTGPYTASRWGDYAAVQPDPVEPGVFWAHHEYAEGSSWRTWIQKFLTTTPPSNNACDEAILVTEGATPFSNIGATTNGPAEPTCAGGDDVTGDVWYRFIATCDNDVTIDVCDADFNAVVGAYFISCPAQGGTLVACDSTGCVDGNAQITFTPNPGFQYIIRIAGVDGETGSGTLNIACLGGKCIGDLNDDGMVSTPDLLMLLSEWGACKACESDLNGDNNVDTVDLLMLLGGWGPCP